jgi:hypothetical protein
MHVRVPILSNFEKNYIIKETILCIESKKEPSQLVKYITKNVEMFQDVILITLSYHLIEDVDNISKTCKKFKFLEHEIKMIMMNFTKLRSTVEAMSEIRQFVYKIIHYNIDHKLFAKTIIGYCSKSKYYVKYIHDIVMLSTKFDLDVININQCKAIHTYEIMLINIFLLLINDIGLSSIGKVV